MKQFLPGLALITLSLAYAGSPKLAPGQLGSKSSTNNRVTGSAASPAAVYAPGKRQVSVGNTASAAWGDSAARPNSGVQGFGAARGGCTIYGES